jgi:hypothetical protein
MRSIYPDASLPISGSTVSHGVIAMLPGRWEGRMKRFGCLLVMALLPAAGAFAAPTSATPESRPDKPTMSDGPSNAPIDILWQRILERGDTKGIRKTYELTATLYQGTWRVSAAGCDARAKEIAEALQINPVSFAVLSMAADCAAAEGNAAMEVQRRESLRALMQQAVDALPPDNGAHERQPIRILQESDAFAFAHASGETVLQARYESDRGFRHMPLALVLWDSSRLRERTLWFDFLEPLLQLAHDPRRSFPTTVNGLAGRHWVNSPVMVWQLRGPLNFWMHLQYKVRRTDSLHMPRLQSRAISTLPRSSLRSASSLPPRGHVRRRQLPNSDRGSSRAAPAQN